MAVSWPVTSPEFGSRSVDGREIELERSATMSRKRQSAGALIKATPLHLEVSNWVRQVVVFECSGTESEATGVRGG